MEPVLPDWRVGALAASGMLNLAMAAALAGAGREPERRIAGVLVVLTGVMAPYVLIVSGVERAAPWSAWLPLSIPLALGPLLWGYIRAQTRGAEADRLWLHLIPALIHIGWIGLLLALGLSRLVTRLLYGVDPADPLTFVMIPFVLLVIAALATFVPAWRASRVDPVEALRV